MIKARPFTVPTFLMSMALLALLVPGGAWPPAAQAQPAAPLAPAPAPDRTQVSTALSSAPLMFVENVGQFDERARFQVRSGNGTFYLADDALWFTVLEQSQVDASPHQTSATTERFNAPREEKPRQGVSLKLSFVGANLHPRLEPFNRLDTYVSCFIGNNPAKWHADVPVWGGVRYMDLYPGVDLEITGEGGRWAWRFISRNSPFAIRHSDVRLRVDGADALALNGDRLRLSTACGEFTLPLLEIVATDGSPLPMLGEGPGVRANTITHPFFLSPAPLLSVSPQGTSDLLYSTFLGGSSGEVGEAIAVDGAGNAYLTGWTDSSGFPTTPGAFDTGYSGNRDAFVAKLNADGTNLIYATFLGGGSQEEGLGIAVDGTGNAYVAGYTYSSNFPTTAGAYDTSYNGNGDAFVVKLNASGTALAYATFVGGSSNDGDIGGMKNAAAIAIDGTGNAYVTGPTYSSNFPTTAGAYDNSYNSGGDTFVVKLNAAGTGLSYATFLGGGNQEEGLGIAVDGVGNAYVAGFTYSSNFPTTPGAFDTSCGTDGNCNDYYSDAFVVKLNAGGTALAYATFLGGSSDDSGHTIAVDGAGSVYVAGVTESSNFPTTTGAYDTSYNGGGDTFVAKLNATGTELAYATFLGGGDDDWAGSRGMAVDGVGNTYMTGYTKSSDFPTTPGAYDTGYNGGGGDAFAAKLSAAGTKLAYATFLGGGMEWDGGFAITIDGAGSAYVTGWTGSPDFPTTAEAFDTYCGTDWNCDYDGFDYYYDAFVTKLALTTNRIYLPLILRNY